MSSEVIKILDDLCARFGIAIDWTSENVIPQLEIIACNTFPEKVLIDYLTVYLKGGRI